MTKYHFMYWKNIVCQAITLVAFVVMTSGCGKSDGTILHYVVPDGYTGYFWIVIDKEKGEVIKSTGRTYLIKIPESGILKVKDFSFRKGWHKLKGSYYSGATLPTIDD